MNLGRFGPIPVRPGCFSLGCFGPISGAGHFDPVRMGHSGPIHEWVVSA